MVVLKAILGAAIGGAIGAAIWAGIAYGAGVEIGWIAWGAGLLAGGGALALARDEASVVTGVAAACISLVALAAGRYAAMSMIMDRELGSMEAYVATDESMLVSFADDVVYEWEEQGKTIKWPEGMTVEEADQESDYPKDVWKEAKARWGELSPEEQQEAKAENERAIAEMMQAVSSTIVKEGFMASFDFMDIIFGGLALLTAYKVGSGLSRE